MSLIQDQVCALTAIDIPAAALNSSTDADASRRIYSDCINDHLKLLYVTPEKLARSDSFRTLLMKLYEADKLRAFIADEAHW